MVRLKAFGYLVDILGWQEKTVAKPTSDATVAVALQLVVGEGGSYEWLLEQILKGTVMVFVNGAAAGLDKTLDNDDEVALIPLPSGG